MTGTARRAARVADALAFVVAPLLVALSLADLVTGRFALWYCLLELAVSVGLTVWLAVAAYAARRAGRTGKDAEQ